MGKAADLEGAGISGHQEFGTVAGGKHEVVEIAGRVTIDVDAEDLNTLAWDVQAEVA